jgi:hypothetical protein
LAILPCYLAKSFTHLYITHRHFKPAQFNHEDGGSTFLQNVGIQPQTMWCNNPEDYNLKNCSNMFAQESTNFVSSTTAATFLENCTIFKDQNTQSTEAFSRSL